MKTKSVFFSDKNVAKVRQSFEKFVSNSINRYQTHYPIIPAHSNRVNQKPDHHLKTTMKRERMKEMEKEGEREREAGEAEKEGGRIPFLRMVVLAGRPAIHCLSTAVHLNL